MGRRYDRFSRALAYAAVETCLSEGDRVARARYLGRGGTYAVYRVDVVGRSGAGKEPADLVARIPRLPLDDGSRNAAAQEVRILRQLAGEDLPFRVPRVRGHVEIEGRPVMVQEACWGMPLPDRRQGRHDPLTMLARIAASVHAVDMVEWPEGVFDEARSRRSHVRQRRKYAAEDAAPTLEEALAFVDEHTPDDVPGHLLHGDLLPQNVLAHPDLPVALLDWALAGCGDPASDLAVVTRGVRRPFGEPDGRTRLLETYNAAAPRAVTSTEVYVHELLDRMIGYGELRRSGASEPHLAQEEQIVLSLLTRARRAAS